MIHVQIASQVTAQGVNGVRWVLVEDLEVPLAAPPDPTPVTAATVAAPMPPAGSPTAGALQLGALKLVAVGLGLGAALWTAHVQVGPPGATHAHPAVPAPQVTPAIQAPGAGPALAAPPAQVLPLPPAALPDSASPPLPAASGRLPRLTAAL